MQGGFARQEALLKGAIEAKGRGNRPQAGPQFAPPLPAEPSRAGARANYRGRHQGRPVQVSRVRFARILARIRGHLRVIFDSYQLRVQGWRFLAQIRGVIISWAFTLGTLPNFPQRAY